LLHPADAQRAIEMGIDGLFVTNHGGRQVESLPASIDVLPAIAEKVAGRATLIFDSGVRSGADAARAIALGADAAFAGKAFLWSLGALGDRGPEHFIRLLVDELRASMGQLGCSKISELRSLDRKHPSAWPSSSLGG
jgi:L-lactate dehydrogenase (cytochrome)